MIYLCICMDMCVPDESWDWKRIGNVYKYICFVWEWEIVHETWTEKKVDCVVPLMVVWHSSHKCGSCVLYTQPCGRVQLLYILFHNPGIVTAFCRHFSVGGAIFPFHSGSVMSCFVQWFWWWLCVPSLLMFLPLLQAWFFLLLVDSKTYQLFFQ